MVNHKHSWTLHSFTHGMSICVDSKIDNSNLFSKCINIIRQYVKGTFLNTNLWFHHPDSFSTPDEFSEFDKDLGSQGFLPANLSQVLKQWGIQANLIKQCIIDLDFAVSLKTIAFTFERFNKKLDIKLRLKAKYKDQNDREDEYDFSNQ